MLLRDYFNSFNFSAQKRPTIHRNQVIKATTTATATKTSLENISLFHLCHFAIISTRSTFTKMANYPGTKLVRVAHKLRKKMKHSPPCVHVLHKTLNWAFHVVVLQRTAKKCTKCKTHVQSNCFCSLNLLFCGVVVAVAVVVA